MVFLVGGIIPGRVGWAMVREDVSPLQGLGFLAA